MAVVNSKLGKVSLFLANPMVAKLDRVEESGEPESTVKGIARKTLFLLLLTVLGVGLFFLTNPLFASSVEVVEGYSVNIVQTFIALGLILVGGIGTFICFKFVRASFFFGSVYSLAQGYSFAWAFNILGKDFLYGGLVALGITILIVLVMLLLYRMKLIKVEKKFVSCLVTLIFSGILLSLVVFIMSLIPVTKEYANFIIENSGIVALCSVFGIIIASLFLLVDFSVIEHSIDSKLPKKYEWLSAFALSFSIIELYLKILELVLKVFNSKEG